MNSTATNASAINNLRLTSLNQMDDLPPLASGQRIQCRSPLVDTGIRFHEANFEADLFDADIRKICRVALANAAADVGSLRQINPTVLGYLLPAYVLPEQNAMVYSLTDAVSLLKEAAKNGGTVRLNIGGGKQEEIEKLITGSELDEVGNVIDWQFSPQERLRGFPAYEVVQWIDCYRRNACDHLGVTFTPTALEHGWFSSDPKQCLDLASEVLGVSDEDVKSVDLQALERFVPTYHFPSGVEYWNQHWYDAVGYVLSSPSLRQRFQRSGHSAADLNAGIDAEHGSRSDVVTAEQIERVTYLAWPDQSPPTHE